MSDHQIAWNETTRVATVQNLGATVPSGSTKIGEFEHDDLDHDGRDELGYLISHVLYHHVRDAMYDIDIFNMQKINIVDTSTLILGTLGPANITVTGGTPEGTFVANITGKHSSSILSISPNDGTITINGNDVSGWHLSIGSEPLSVGSYEYELTETLEGAQGSPKTSLINIHVVSLVLSIGNGAGWLSMLAGMSDGTTSTEGNAGGYLPAFLTGAATGKAPITGVAGGSMFSLNGYATGTTKTSSTGAGFLARLMGSASGLAIEKVSEANGAGFLSFLTGAGTGSITVPDTPTIVFDDTVNTSNKTLTNLDQTFELTSDSTNKPMFIQPTVTGLVYIEVTVNAIGSGELGISVGMATNKTLTNVVTDSGAVSLYQANPADGSPGSAVNPEYDRHWTNITAWQVNDTIRLEFNSTEQSVRFALNGNAWTDKYYAADYSDGSDWLYIVVGALKTGTKLTVNGGSSPFAYPPSYGYNGPDASPYWSFSDLAVDPLIVMDPMSATWELLDPPLWTPAELDTAIVVWYDASDTSTMTLSGSDVISLRTKAGGNEMTPGNSSHGTYNATGLNGGPTIDLTTSYAYLSTSSSAFPAGANATCEFVIGCVGIGNYQNSFGYGDRYIGTLYNGHIGMDSHGYEDTGITPSTDGNIIVWNIGAGSTPASNWYVDGNLVASGTRSAFNSSTSYLVFGSNGTNTSKKLSCYILLNRLPTTDEREKLEGWGAWHFWGSGSRLPLGHTYKTAPPTL